MRTQLTRKISISASHRLISSHLSPEENADLFGKCYSPNGHGHNYEVSVTLQGEVDPRTGIVFDLVRLKEIMMEEIHEPFDHKHLNLDCNEFKELNPTTENLAQIIFKKIDLRLPKNLLYSVEVWETSNNVVRVLRG